MRSSAARQRKPGTRKRINNNVEDDEHELLSLPLHRAAAALQATSPGRRQDESVKIRRRKLRRRWVGSRTFALVIASILAGVTIVIIVADRSWVRYSLFSFPRYHRLKLVNPAVPIESAKIAIVSIHKGWKYHGSLGTFLVNNKQSYANLHGYAYADAVPDEKDLMPLEQPAMRLHNRPVYYEKPRFLLYLMEQNSHLEWLLWIDGDAIITQPYVSVEERIKEFEKLHRATGSSSKRQLNNLCLVWAEDMMPKAGVLLIRNNPTSRELFRKALDTWVESDTFRSFTQASLTAAIDRNVTYQGCSLLLSEHRSVLLQSRVRGAANGLWKSGHWVLHLPNHNYLELLGSLKRVGRTLRRDPPPLIPPLERPSIESLSTTRKDRFTKVQNAIRHAWGGYSRTCLQPSSSTTRRKVLGSHIPCDDLSPIAGVGHDWLYHAATLHDSLDTLAIAFGTESDEYPEGLNVILRQDIQATSLRPTKTFEYSLRVVGGLLGVFSVTGDVRLLARAKDAVDSLLQSPFASSPTDLPRMFDVLFPSRGGSLFHTAYSKLYDWGRDTFTKEHHFNSLAGIGSFSLEFHYLSQILGDEKYKSFADKIFRHVSHYQAPDGSIPSQWNVMTGEPINLNGGLGSGSDSFVEYLLKVPLLYCTANSDFSPCVQDHPVVQEMFSLYQTMMEKALPKHIVWRKRSDDKIAFPTENLRYHQLLCFLPGMLALGVSAKASASGTNELTLAEQLIEGCHEMYNHSATGLGPEEALFDHETTGNVVLPKISNPSFLLRPEYIESIFVLYRLTGNEHYQDLGWKVFESLDHYCKTKSGYVGLKGVTDPGAGFIDDMPSYFLAETLKYLLLLFASDDFISLDDFVLTTEAHPLRRRLHGNDNRKYGNYIKEELSDNAYAIPAPGQLSASTLVVFVSCSIFGVIACTKGKGCCLRSTFSVRGKAT